MNPRDSAFPVVAESSSEVHFGLTKREYFAIMIYANGDGMDPRLAVKEADELISELSKSQPQTTQEKE